MQKQFHTGRFYMLHWIIEIEYAAEKDPLIL